MSTSTLQNIFDATLEREGKTVTCYFSGETFTCFFRRLSDGLNQRSTMTMFYPVGTNVHSGSIVTINEENYVLLNQETIENDVYYKSSVIKCNGTLSTQDADVIGLPFYGAGASSADPSGDRYLNIIDGKTEIITEDCTLSRNLEVNDRFNAFGRTWKIVNIFYIDGIATVNIEVQADEDITFTYGISFTDINASGYAVGDSAMLDAYGTINGNVVDATLTYTSSNTDVATVDDEGTITFVGYGSVSFNITWSNQNITETTTTTTIEEITEDVITLNVTKCGQIYAGLADGTVTVTTQRNGETVHDIAFEVSTPDCSFASKLNITSDQSTGIVTINIPTKYTYDLVNKSFNLAVTLPDYNLTDVQTIKIVALI